MNLNLDYLEINVLERISLYVAVLFIVLCIGGILA